jgi:hypothetical protein
MATFYVLPARQDLGQRFGDLLSALFPGTSYPEGQLADLAETLGTVVEANRNVCVVFREDLDEEQGVRAALMRHFGAELSDDIVEIHLGEGLRPIAYQRWSTEAGREAA